MIQTTEELASTLELTTKEEAKYIRLFNRTQRKIRSKRAYDAFSMKVLKSKRYSYDVKQKFVMNIPWLPASRSWSLGTLSGISLKVFIFRVLVLDIKFLNLEDIQRLINNPAFIASIGSEHDSVRLIFSTLTGYSETECIVRQQLISELVSSPNMSIEIAEIIFSATSDPWWEGVQMRWRADETPVVDWVRKAYNLDENIPDAWVRQFCASAV